MQVDFNIRLLDIRTLRWGQAPVPVVAKALRNKWKNEKLPSWLLDEIGLPEGATISVLGNEYWNSAEQLSPRVRHFAEYLIRTRAYAIDTIPCVSQQWPVGLDPKNIPFGTRSEN